MRHYVRKPWNTFPGSSELLYIRTYSNNHSYKTYINLKYYKFYLIIPEYSGSENIIDNNSTLPGPLSVVEFETTV